MSQFTGSRRRIAAALVLVLSVAPVAFRIGPEASAYQTVNPLMHGSAAAVNHPPQAVRPGHSQSLALAHSQSLARPLAHPKARAHHRHRGRRRICPIDWRRGPAFVERLIRCAARHWHVPGGPRTALSIAWRESHFIATAYNSSGAEGIYQHLRQYWPARARLFGFPDRSAFNARVNIIVTMRMVHATGSWAPWGQG
jgi:hypothetical protein